MASTSKQTQRSRNRRSVAPTVGKGAKSTIQCVCGSKREFGMMIQCEECFAWQHGPCVGLNTEEDCPQQYYCERCRPDLHSSSSRQGSSSSSKRIESKRNVDPGKQEWHPHRSHPYPSGSTRGLLSRGTPPHNDIVASSALAPPCSSTLNSALTHTTDSGKETRNPAKSRAEDPGIEVEHRSSGQGETSTEQETQSETSRAKSKAPVVPQTANPEPDKPYVYRGIRVGKMLALSTYAQTVLPEESKRLAMLEAFAARAAEVNLTDRPGEFDGQLVREIVGLREVKNPSLVGSDPETKRTLELAEELSRDLLAFQEKYGRGNSFVPAGRRERTAREAAAVARRRMTGESDDED